MNVLIIDDYESSRLGTALFMRELAPDIQVFHADSCENGIDIAQKQPLHLVMLDIRFPRGRLQGLEALVEIKRQFESLCVVVYSGVDDDREGVRAHCLALGGVDLTSPAGKMTMQVIAAVAEFERDLLIERTQAGLQRAREQGRVGGRPATFSDDKRAEIRGRLQAGESVNSLAKAYDTSRQTIMRIRDGKQAM